MSRALLWCDNKMFRILILFVLFQSSTAVIHRLNDSDLARMPPLFHLDNYEECFDNPEAIYCLAEFSLVSDEPSQLLTMIQEFSEFPLHYNRSLLRHGYCMNKTCKKFYNASGGDLKWSLEACVNESLYNNYKLKAIVSDDMDCSKRHREQPMDNLDIAVAVICIVIVLANLIGSLCDSYLKKGRDRAGLRFLYCFSIFLNWKKFVARPGKGRDSRLEKLKGIHGIRALSIYLVVTAHSMFLGIVFIIKPEEIEALYDIKVFTIFANATLIMQTFLVMSSFLLAYTWLIDTEKQPLSWSMLPKQIIVRWLRLTPAYALVLGLTVTWFGRLATGPLWKRIVYDEIIDCRRDWWKHLFYLNNYFERSLCMPQTWYLAADTQLYCFGVIIFLMCRTGLTRKVVLSLLFVAGLIIPTLHIYYQNLHGALLGHPEMAMNFLTKDPTFHHIYIKGHTNLSAYVIGMAFGYIIYDWQKSGGDPNKFRKYRYLYWSTLFWGILCTFSGSVYYLSTEPVPIYIEMLIGALAKPCFGIVIAIGIAGVVIQFEGLFRSILEWQPFLYVSRLSYSAYLLHVALIRTEAASLTAVQSRSIIGSLLKSCTIVMGTFIAAFFFWHMVESPSVNFIRELLRKPKIHTKEDNKQTKEDKKEAVEESKKTEDDKTTDLGQTTIEDGAIVIKMGISK